MATLSEIINKIKNRVTNTANTSVSNLPTSAFSIDARTYFTSLSDAQEAASLAKDQGSTESIYYFGMNLVVVENGQPTEYIIVKNQSGTGELVKKLTTDKFFIINGGGPLDLQGYEVND